eukprot:UN01022
MFGPMICIRLPGKRVPLNDTEHTTIQDILYYKYNIELPIKMIQNRLYARISCHIYNQWSDYQRLCNAMLEIRPRLIGNDDIEDRKNAENAEFIKPATGC